MRLQKRTAGAVKMPRFRPSSQIYRPTNKSQHKTWAAQRKTRHVSGNLRANIRGDSFLNYVLHHSSETKFGYLVTIPMKASCESFAGSKTSLNSARGAVTPDPCVATDEATMKK